MTRHKLTWPAAVAGLTLAVGLGSPPARADEWDAAVANDNGDATRNVPFHLAQQVHDLAAVAGVADQDWFLLGARPMSSYQFVVDGVTGDLDLQADDVQLLEERTGAVTDARVSDFGGQLTLDFEVGALSVPLPRWVRIRGAACGSSCGSQDRYRVGFYDTTYTVPRFNNTGSQVTVLQVQNATDRDCAIAYWFFDDAGQLLVTSGLAIRARELLVLSTDAGLLVDTSGSARISHTCGHGGLTGKAVSIEPATGFTFDTALQSRP
jgi:hypothetical protein